MAKQDPQRSCLGCRQVRDKSDLIRFVVTPERAVVPDIATRLPGRGAYTCPTEQCVRETVKKKQFNRAFKGETTAVTPDEMIGTITVRIEERLASFIALANKAGKAVSGTDMVLEAIRKGEAGVVVIARDSSPDISEKISRTAARTRCPALRLLDKERLAALLGKELRAAAAIQKGGLADTVIKEFDKYRNFFQGGAQER